MSEPRRLFFALWPDDEVRERIEAARYPRLKPRTTPRENWHMTLVFLGATTTEQQSRLEGAADGINIKPFTLNLDITGQFDAAQVVWLGCDDPHPRLMALQGKLASTLGAACPEHPARVSGQQLFRPHVTLYRHVRESHPPENIESIAWPVHSFCLIESCRGRQPAYRIVKRWPLNPVITS